MPSPAPFRRRLQLRDQLRVPNPQVLEKLFWAVTGLIAMHASIVQNRFVVDGLLVEDDGPVHREELRTHVAPEGLHLDVEIHKNQLPFKDMHQTLLLTFPIFPIRCFPSRCDSSLDWNL